ncbi:hypothetical protein NOF04DRAFT_18210 [Fusarium oxysporum II5]|nr:uncharacterized protein FOIG_15700 [Fusarium odoratissimum NRRL 54006]EXL91126.1 hypothetical protein FOIG_15700 [Fusarium odoratissimum NRRL 54006]KAK2127618.1 hypothetical protein NOF04DRAFT_18210 [Fusarium oxysporum II5]
MDSTYSEAASPSYDDHSKHVATLLGSQGYDFPNMLDETFLANHPKLCREQVGHLRHFHNLATQRDGEWRHMVCQKPGQEWLDAYRYQLATMVYASALTHYHRLPLLRSVFKVLMEKLIHKMLLRDVWGYWFMTSHSGKRIDPDLTELRKPWANPVTKENIMYSGHLLLMVSLYTMLFDDDKYNEKDALEFNWDPMFWGMGPERFCYTRKTLQNSIISEMERENWLGVCCEPNSIFINCNQFPLIALHYNDVRDGTSVSREVIEKYKLAWKTKGMFQDNGLFIEFLSVKQDKKQLSEDIWSSAWTGAFMNAWNTSVAHDTYKSQSVGFLAKPNSEHVLVSNSRVAFQIRELVKTEGADPMAPSTYAKATEMIASKEQTSQTVWPLIPSVFGYVVQWVSELGDQDTLDGLLSFVDSTFNPTWDQGGLFYPFRTSAPGNDSLPNVDAFSGNAGIAYGRLNVFEGQRKMYSDPWTTSHFSTSPFVDNVDLSCGVDFLRGTWDDKRKALAMTIRSWDGTPRELQPRFSGLEKGIYGVYHNSELCEIYNIDDRMDTIELSLQVSGADYDLVILQG